MRNSALCVIAIAALCLSNAFPHNAQEMNAKAADEEKQASANLQFAEELSGKVKSNMGKLDHMNVNEEKSIADAKKMATMSTQTLGPMTANEIKAADSDASKMSAEIQAEAEQVDKNLLAVKSEMDAAHVPKTPAQMQTQKELGDSPEDLQAEKREQVARAKLVSMSDMAAKDYQSLQKSETRLHADLNGHDDLRLEQDIRVKEQDMERRQTKGEALGENDPVHAEDNAQPQPVNITSELEAVGEAEESGKFMDGITKANFAPDAMAAPEPHAAPAPHAAPTSTLDAAPSAPDAAEMADLSAIDNDAVALEKYQKSSEAEIDAIKKPLQDSK